MAGEDTVERSTLSYSSVEYAGTVGYGAKVGERRASPGCSNGLVYTHGSATY